MAWTDREWGVFVNVLQRGFAARDPLTDADTDVYRLLLADVDPAAAMRALEELVLAGQELRPRPGAIAARVRRDAGRPTWTEAFELIFGQRGVLLTLPRGTDLATLNGRFHPLVLRFVASQGVDRLRTLPIFDPDWGEKRRADLGAEWESFAEAHDGREVAAIAAGDRSHLGLRQFDPLAALQAGTSPAPGEVSP